ncbi:uncharacterized protein LOC115622894 [Scaptodrosophila lebanonensis]|uniref:Uncharacterized protein LOC115622894 n=1 Tax=Drosophila lebanonensis TaxID=7225 RepID=A0A6J2TA13_DROLE|nr:uncharacterized protein LOC115622894 [Scaptodrosophila lebanonensis]
MYSGSWILEHVTTGTRIFLKNGDNTIGRHSSCRHVLKYDYLSREHVNLHVRSDNVVVVNLMKALNGVFINESMIEETGTPLREGDRISLGVETTTIQSVSHKYAVFVLKKFVADAIILSSDDEEDVPVVHEDGLTNVIKNEPVSVAQDSRENRLIHMPKLPDCKQEIVQNTTDEIRNIFGEPDDIILNPLIHLNPYVFNKLQATVQESTPISQQICDGDIIELAEEVKAPDAIPPTKGPVEEEIILSDSDYDEDFAMSQAVLQEMKEEMNDLMPETIRSEFFENIEDDDVIIIEDNDEDLDDKVADWSSKLLSQNVNQLSQIYQLPDSMEASDIEIESGSEDSLHPPRLKSLAMRLDSSSSSEETSTVCQADCLTAHANAKCNFREVRVILKKCNAERFTQNKDEEVLSTHVAHEPTKKTNIFLTPEKEIIFQEHLKKTPLSSDTPKTISKTTSASGTSDAVTPKTTYKMRARSKTISSRSELEQETPEKIVLNQCAADLKDSNVLKNSRDIANNFTPNRTNKVRSRRKTISLNAEVEEVTPRKGVRDQEMKDCTVVMPHKGTHDNISQNTNKAVRTRRKTISTRSELEEAKGLKDSNILEHSRDIVNNITPNKTKTISSKYDLEEKSSEKNLQKLDAARKDEDKEGIRSEETGEKVLRYHCPADINGSDVLEQSSGILSNDTPTRRYNMRPRRKTISSPTEVEEETPKKSVRDQGMRDCTVLTPQKGIQDNISPNRTNKICARRKTISSRFELEEEIPENKLQKLSTISKDEDNAVLEHSKEKPHTVSPSKTHKSPLKSRSLSSPSDIEAIFLHKTAKTHAITSNDFEKFNITPSEQKTMDATTPNKISSVEKTNKGHEKTKPHLPSRLRNRAKTICIELPAQAEKSIVNNHFMPAKKSYDQSSITLSPNNDFERGPKVIEAPHLPKHRGHLRGVSAMSKADEQKQKVLERQRFVDRAAYMTAKWLTKPSTKKKENAIIREKRKEELKKISVKEKVPEVSSDKKRKHSTVRTKSSTSNRGAFLTEAIAAQPPAKTRKLNENDKTPVPTLPTKQNLKGESFSQQLKAADKYLESTTHSNRPRERREAETARNQRTCNRVTFAEMEREFELRKELNKKFKKVRFSDKVIYHEIERVKGANSKVQTRKDTRKTTLSTYAERREWALQKNKILDHTDYIIGDILRWSNRWLQLRSVDAVAESEVLLPIPHEFKDYKQYKNTLVPLMLLELISTIERGYKIAKTKQVTLENFYKERDRLFLVTKYEMPELQKFDLYTLSTVDGTKETFASLYKLQRSSRKVWEFTFQVLQKDFSVENLNDLKKVVLRPVVDNIRVELGAINAVYHIGHSQLFRKILKPSENVSAPMQKLKKSSYKGFRLNPQQMDICLRTYHRLVDDVTPSITLIQGPPGTGKSYVISNLSLQCMYGTSTHICDRKILICAQSNTAVDNITEYLKNAHDRMTHDHFELLRFGVYEKMLPKVRSVSLQSYLARERANKSQRLSSENMENIKQQQQHLEKEIAEMRPRVLPGTSLQQQLEEMERKLRQLNDLLDTPLTPREEHQLSIKYIQRANIICTTLSSCVKLANFIDYFDICIIDEATQCTEPWTLLPCARFRVHGLVLVGDTQQLPATVLSQKAANLGLANSMFSRIQRSLLTNLDKPSYSAKLTNIFKLSTQYRMHPEICKWPNQYFYENELINAECTTSFTAPIIPYCVINLSYTSDASCSTSRSIQNDDEAEFVANLLVALNKVMPTNRYKYGVITPYTKHCMALRRSIPQELNVSPNTIDAYQGLQRDVVIISNARTRGVGFLSSYQRLNVAITRPRRALIICGNFKDLEGVEMWRHLITNARERNIFFSIENRENGPLDSLISKLLLKKES